MKRKPESPNNEVNLGADAVVLTASKVITAAISLVMTMLLARIRSKGEMATYSQLLQMVDMLSVVIMLGLPKSLNYFLCKAIGQEQKRKFLSLYYTLNTILSLIVGAVLVASAKLVADHLFHNPAILAFLYFLALYPWTKIITSSVENLLIVSRKTKTLVFFRISNSVSLLLCVGFSALLDLSFSTYMILFLAVELVYTLAVYLLANEIGHGIKPYCSRALLREVLGFSVPLGIASVVGTLNTYLDRTIIGCFLTPELYAEYSMAARELPLAIITSSVSSVMIPQMTRMFQRGKNKEGVALWKEATVISFTILSFFGTACIVFSRDVLMVLYGAGYTTERCCIVFALYAVYLFIRCTYFGMALNAIGKSKLIFLCAVISLALNAVSNVLFFFLFRMFGQEFISPAVATILTSIIMNVLQLIMTAKALRQPFSEVFPWKKAGMILLLNAGMGGFFLLLKQVLPFDGLLSFSVGGHFIDGSAFESILLGIVWAILYFGVSARFLKRAWKKLKVNDEEIV